MEHPVRRTLATGAALLVVAGLALWVFRVTGDPAQSAGATLAPVGAPAASTSEPPGATATDVPRPEPPARFYYDLATHSTEEIIAMLSRAEAIGSGSEGPAEIVMVLHGPDLTHFRRPEAGAHSEIHDRAARLDADGVIDFKACLRSVEEQGLSADAFPGFIEMVPLAPREISRLREAGYLAL